MTAVPTAGPDLDRAFADLAALVALGPRVAGSPEEARAADYLTGRLKAAGLTAALWPFPTRLWTERLARLELPGDGGREIAMTAVPFGGVTGGPVELPLAFADGFGIEAPQRDALAGKAWLVPRDSYRDYPDRALVEAAAPFAPAAFLFTAAPGHRGGVPTVYYNFRDRAEAPPPPMATIGFDDAVDLVRRDVGAIRLTIDADVGPATSANVVGVLAGSTRPDEIVVVSAHVDSAHTSPGACDNAGGAAVVVELARLAAAAGGFDRTIHFAIWGSHETGMHGSEAYIAEALRSGARVVAAINYDLIGLLVASETLFTLGGERWSAFAEAAVRRSGVAPAVVPGPGYTDYTNFGAAGIPSISFGQGYGAWNHTPGDNLDRVGPRGLARPLRMGWHALSAIAGPELPDLSDDFTPALLATVRAHNGRWGWSRFTPPDP
jgi:Iap family predicted aminopeptidase